MNRSDLVKQALWLKAIAGTALDEYKKVKAAIEEQARAEFDQHGTAQTYRLPDLAVVASSVSHDAVAVTDEAAFTKWVQTRYPDGVEEITRVRGSWQAAFLSGNVVRHGTELVDTETGEIVPGLTARLGGKFTGVTIRPTAAAVEVFSTYALEALKVAALQASPAVPVVLAEIGTGDGA